MPRLRSALLLAGLLAVFLAGVLIDRVFLAEAPQPKPQLVVRCRVVEVYDGDTLTAELTLPMRIRLVDCWAPEIRTTDAAEKARGIKARDWLKDHATGKSGTLAVDLDGVDRLDDVITLGRVLGRVHLDGDDRDLSAEMVGRGFATTTKQGNNP